VAGALGLGPTEFIAEQLIRLRNDAQTIILCGKDEELQKRVQELNVRNKELEAFSYMVSHDLKTPVMMIEGFSRRIRKEGAYPVEDKRSYYLDIIEKCARKMDQMIRDLLAYCHMGSEELKLAPVDMANLVESLCEELKPLQGERAVEVKVGDVPKARADASMINQVWMNLLMNAFKFSRKRDPAIVEIGGRSMGEAVTYFVKDNGAGFDGRQADRLFDLFYRFHGVREFEGTGVGLAVVKRIVERHGGKVWAEGEINKGATFYFTLPNSEEAPALSSSGR